MGDGRKFARVELKPEMCLQCTSNPICDNTVARQQRVQNRRKADDQRYSGKYTSKEADSGTDWRLERE